MRLTELAVLYGVVGLACAIGLSLRAPTGAKPGVVDALLCLLAWPLYVPVWMAGRTGAPVDEGVGEMRGAIGREYGALVDALRAVRDPLVASLLPAREQLDRLFSHLRGLDGRVGQLDEVLAGESFDAASAGRALGEAERRGQGVEQARLALESIERLRRLRARAARAALRRCRRGRGARADGRDPGARRGRGRRARARARGRNGRALVVRLRRSRLMRPMIPRPDSVSSRIFSTTRTASSASFAVCSSSRALKSARTRPRIGPREPARQRSALLAHRRPFARRGRRSARQWATYPHRRSRPRNLAGEPSSRLGQIFYYRACRRRHEPRSRHRARRRRSPGRPNRR